MMELAMRWLPSCVSVAPSFDFPLMDQSQSVPNVLGFGWVKCRTFKIHLNVHTSVVIRTQAFFQVQPSLPESSQLQAWTFASGNIFSMPRALFLLSPAPGPRWLSLPWSGNGEEGSCERAPRAGQCVIGWKFTLDMVQIPCLPLKSSLLRTHFRCILWLETRTRNFYPQLP